MTDTIAVLVVIGGLILLIFWVVLPVTVWIIMRRMDDVVNRLDRIMQYISK